MKRFVVVENPPKSRAVPAFRPVVFTRGKARRNFAPSQVTTALNRPGRRKARRNVIPALATTALNPRSRRPRLGPVASALRSALGRRKKITKRKLAGGPRVKNRRRGNANAGGSKMATAKQRAAQRKFIARFAGKKSRKKKGRRARQNKRGRPLSGRSYRPTLPKGPLRVIVKTVKRKYKKSLSRASKAGRKAAKKRRKSATRRPRSRAKKNPVYTVFNNGRRRGKRLSASRARAMSMKRWHGKRKSTRRRARRNFGGGIISAFKSALSMRTAKSGLAVLANAHNVPFTVAAPTSTFDPRTATGADIPIEERSREEVARLGDTVLVADGIPCLHPAFDVTPARLIDRITSERGSFSPKAGETA